jgi:hypothetical protein
MQNYLDVYSEQQHLQRSPVFCPMLWISMAAMGYMGSMMLLWFDTPSMAPKQVLLMLC